MNKLDKKELLEIEGGAFNPAIALGISAGIVFLIGVIDGFVRPMKCN